MDFITVLSILFFARVIPGLFASAAGLPTVDLGYEIHQASLYNARFELGVAINL